MKLSSYIKKIILIIKAKISYKKNQISANLYAFNFSLNTKYDRVIFALNDSEYMHLGDYLFILPVIKSFVDNGYNVIVHSTAASYDFLHKLNFPVTRVEPTCSGNDLLISRFELIPLLHTTPSIFIHVSKNLTMPICSQLLYEFNSLFDFKPYLPIDYSVFAKENLLQWLNLPPEKKIIIFNPYCDASSYLVTTQKRMKIIDFVTRLQQQNDNSVIVFTGSLADKNADKFQNYDFVYLDLRGKTSIIDIFSLVSAKNVLAYVGFDSFTMHVFSLYSKPSYVVFRGRISRRQSMMLQKFHVNLFTGDKWVSLL